MKISDIRQLTLELTFLCNHSCKFCSQVIPNRADVRLSDNLVSNLEPVFEHLNAISVSGGEAFLWPKCKDLIGRIKEINPNVAMGLVTNGTSSSAYWRNKFSEGLLRNGSINVSINAGTEESYKFIHGRPHFQKAIDFVKFIGELKQDQLINSTVSCVVSKKILGELTSLTEHVAGIADRIQFQEMRREGLAEDFLDHNLIDDTCRDVFYQELDKCHEIAHKKGTEVIALTRGRNPYRYKGDSVKEPGLTISRSSNTFPDPAALFKPSPIEKMEVKPQCPDPWQQLTIFADGNVHIGCCISGHVIGNINHQTIGELLENPIIAKVQEQVLAGNHDFCAMKNMREKCPYPSLEQSRKIAPAVEVSVE